MVKKNILPVFIVALAVALFAGCAQKPAEKKAETQAEKPMTIGMVIKDPTAPYEVAFAEGAKAKAKELGITVDIKDGQADSLKIMELMDNYITQKVDGFIMAGAVDLKAIVPGVKKLNEAKIPIMALDTSPEGGKVDLFISFDIEQASKKATEAFVQGIKDRNGGQVPNGVVIEITGALEDMFTRACNKGFQAVISQYPQLKVVQGEGKWDNTISHERASDLLTRYGKEVLGIYVHTPDIMAPGVVTAIESHKLDPKDFGIAGICIGPEGIDLIKQGKMLAAVEQPAYDSAVLAVQYLYDLKKGKPIPQIGDTVKQDGAIWSPATVVKNPWAEEGGYMILQGPLVPTEVKVDDPRLWENKLSSFWKK
ncbi:MAG: sugar ABC transporter substrate-binding protein [Peptococcaceae bacterium]|jgi:ribose transport system substrate-binding protein|nr:sugar ABC transporter substrate-binding protein [Peptococcaceae bacterium]MDH7524929.1 sugar ABC transporter substrate-binding protein [Peptococcaceae bacterium]